MPFHMRVEWDEASDVEQMWEQMQRAVVDSARELCGSVRAEKRIKVRGEMVYLRGSGEEKG